jgi:hypothetical protein
LKALAAVASGVEASPAWDADAADAELRQAIAVMDTALSALWLSQPQRNLLAVFRQQVCDCHARHNPQLFGFPAWIKAHVRRWRADHQNAISRG